MKDLKINNSPSALRILLCPLDWGLGHITRCIPIIYVLRASGAEVICAGDDNTQNILKKEFPDLQILPLKGYKVQYASSKGWFLPKIICQLPYISSIISYEHEWLKKVVTEHHIDAIISDNRLGLYHQNTPCVYITHQLFIETGFHVLNRHVQALHFKYINRYSCCWVPDAADDDNLAGKLSHPARLPTTPVKYLGPLSRFQNESVPKINDILILLSGPEPQRTIFENILLRQLKSYKGEVILVRGLPSDTKAEIFTPSNVTCLNHLSAARLNRVILESKMIITRAGYTTIMDLVSLQQSAILVPTPGQCEQEYLADYLTGRGIFYSCSQQNINLNEELIKANVFYNNASIKKYSFDETVVTKWLEDLAVKKAKQ